VSIKFLDHPSDVYVEVRAKSLKEAFALGGMAVYEVMTDVSRVRKKEKIEVTVEGFDLYSLLYNWLEELIYLFDSKGFLGSEVKVEEVVERDEGFKLKAVIIGERYDANRHESKTAIKAATYHLMEIKREDDEYVVRFVLDI
jgi:SHS2 domain-containing protein